jgi:hypothetical protein
LAIGPPWVARLASIMGVRKTQAQYISVGLRSTTRRRFLILQHYLRQKRGARSSRLEREYEAARRRVDQQDAALEVALAWCEAELAKKK